MFTVGPARTIAIACLAAGIVVAILVEVGFAVANGNAAGEPVHAADLSLAAGFVGLPLVGALVMWRQPGNVVGVLLVSMGVLVVSAVLSEEWAVFALRSHPGSLPGGQVAAWLSSWLLVPGLGLGALFLASFPSGRIGPRVMRRLALVAAAAIAALTVAQAIAPEPIDGVSSTFAPIPNPLGIDGAEGVISAVTNVSVLIVTAFVLVVIVDLIRRFRRADTEERLQLQWFVLAAPLLPISFLIGAVPVAGGALAGVSQVLFLAGLAAGIAIAVLRYRLYELDLFIRRSLLYAALSALVVASYVGLVAATGAVLADRAGTAPSLIAAAIVAVAFHPTRLRLQSAVDRLVYGGRREPYGVISRLGDRLESALAPGDAAKAIVETVATELRLPDVAIKIDGHVVAATRPGAAGGHQFPIVHHGQPIATLSVGQRTPGEPLTPPELRLLTELARQAGAAIHAGLLTSELQRSRERLVTNREEERQRIRRDLHDGLGPTLAGLMLRAEAVGDLVATDPKDAMEQLAELKAGLGEATSDVRRLVQGLRPPVLDEFGLVQALRAQVDALAGNHLRVDLDAPIVVRLSPAQEVAVLRVAGEALTNVVRHSGASHCAVRLRAEREVELDVADDGVGIPDGATQHRGVGLTSMRERASELGGICTIACGVDGGTLVSLRLPCTTS